MNSDTSSIPPVAAGKGADAEQDVAEGLSCPTQDQLHAALTLLEAYGAHPLTGPIHDPIYALTQEPSAAAVASLSAALLRCADHPAAHALRAALGPSVTAPPRSLGAVLSSHGAWTCEDPIDEVDLRLRAAANQRALLLDRLSRQAKGSARLARTADALALVGAILAVAAITGWLGALDLWTVTWFSEDAPPSHTLMLDNAP